LRQSEFSQKSDLPQITSLVEITSVRSHIASVADVQSGGMVKGIEKMVLQADGKLGGPENKYASFLPVTFQC
jgi:hypothetical protein